MERDADDNVVVPQAIKDAVCEEILARLSPIDGKRHALQADGVKSFRLGDLSETYGDDLRGGGIKGTPLISWTAYRLLEPYLAKGRGRDEPDLGIPQPDRQILRVGRVL